MRTRPLRRARTCTVHAAAAAGDLRLRHSSGLARQAFRNRLDRFVRHAPLSAARRTSALELPGFPRYGPRGRVLSGEEGRVPTVAYQTWCDCLGPKGRLALKDGLPAVMTAAAVFFSICPNFPAYCLPKPFIAAAFSTSSWIVLRWTAASSQSVKRCATPGRCA